MTTDTIHTGAELIESGFINIDTTGFDGVRWLDTDFTECFEVVEAYLGQGESVIPAGSQFVLVTLDGDCDQHVDMAVEAK